MKYLHTSLLIVISLLLSSCVIVHIPIKAPDFMVKNKTDKISNLTLSGYANVELRNDYFWCLNQYIVSRDKYIKSISSTKSIYAKRVSLLEFLFKDDDKPKKFSPKIVEECHEVFISAKKECFSKKNLEYCHMLQDTSLILKNDKMYKRVGVHMSNNKNKVDEKIGAITQKQKGYVLESKGVIIQRFPHREKLSWEEAKTYCDELDYGGSDDWRLPVYNELKKLITLKSYMNSDSGYSYKILQTFVDALPNEERIVFWSSTKSRIDVNSSTGFNITKGKGYRYKYNTKNHVICAVPIKDL